MFRGVSGRQSAEGQGIGWRGELGRAGKVVVFGRDVGGEMLCDKDIDLDGPQKAFYRSIGLSVQGARGGWIHVLVAERVLTSSVSSCRES